VKLVYYWLIYLNLAVCYVVILSCLLRKSICDFVSINSDVSFHPFKFNFPVPFVQGYCSFPNFFYEVIVIFGAPFWVQSYSAVRVDDYCPLFVMVNLSRLYGLECFMIASCSAWLLEHLLSSLNLSCSVNTFPVNTATSDPTPCSLLLPSVKICHICSYPSSFVSLTLTISAGWSQLLWVLCFVNLVFLVISSRCLCCTVSRSLEVSLPFGRLSEHLYLCAMHATWSSHLSWFADDCII